MPVTHQIPSVLLVIPCFYESERLPTFLSELITAFENDAALKILVVDDGSSKSEQEILQNRIFEVLKAFPERALSVEIQLNPSNSGKGGAVYSGWNTASSEDFLMFVDADGATSAGEVKRMVEHVRAQNDLNTAIFASRVKMLGRKVSRLWKRHLMGRVYATFVSEIFKIPIYDSQCGCKLVPRHAYEKVREHLTIQGFAFDVDLLLALSHHGFKTVEFPVDWEEIPGGKVHLFRDSFRMFKDILELKKHWN